MQKTVNSNHGLVLFNPEIGPLSGATTPGQSGLGSDGNEGILCIPHSACITSTSSSDCLASYPGQSFVGGSYPSAEKQSVYSTAPANWAKEGGYLDAKIWYGKHQVYCKVKKKKTFLGKCIYIYIYTHTCVCVIGQQSFIHIGLIKWYVVY